MPAEQQQQQQQPQSSTSGRGSSEGGAHPAYPCAKLKLDQLFLQWLSLPDSQHLVGPAIGGLGLWQWPAWDPCIFGRRTPAWREPDAVAAQSLNAVCVRSTEMATLEHDGSACIFCPACLAPFPSM